MCGTNLQFTILKEFYGQFTRQQIFLDILNSNNISHYRERLMLRSKFANMEWVNVISTNRRFTVIEELGSIAKILDDMNMSDTKLFASTCDNFLSSLNENTYSNYNKRLWILRPMFQKFQSKFDDL
jgi:hypothetical protein